MHAQYSKYTIVNFSRLCKETNVIDYPPLTFKPTFSPYSNKLGKTTYVISMLDSRLINPVFGLLQVALHKHQTFPLDHTVR